MPSSPKRYALHGARLVLVVVGAVVTIGTIYALATIPPAPPGSDGFATGMAYLFGGIFLVLALGTTGLGIALPTLLGADDPLGFGRYQRAILKFSGACFVGGFLAGIVVGFAFEFQFGLFFWLGAILIGALAVCVAIAWRVGEFGWHLLLRALGAAE